MQTPCVHVCSIDSATGFCTGCGRNLQEIAGWMTCSDDERRRIMAVLPSRLNTLAPVEPGVIAMYGAAAERPA
jgi:predicted Fe-S protein YdhL (DUF1289 family)